ncbi:MAG: WD40 repeat domain-containing protein [Planctomycetota bacterium]|nr:WD40 repeat domain-containing protein [Planctomycetota bacterium]
MTKTKLMTINRVVVRTVALIFFMMSDAHARDGQPLVGHTAGITYVDSSSDGTRIVSGSRDGTARIWSLERAESLAVLRQETPVTHVRFLDKDRVLVVSEDPTRKVYYKIRTTKRPLGPASRIVVWDVLRDEFQPVQSLGEVGQITHCIVAPDGKQFAVRMIVDGPSGSNELVCVETATDQLHFRRPFRGGIHAGSFKPGPLPPMIGFTHTGNSILSVEAERQQDVLVMLNAMTGVVEAELKSGGAIGRIDTSSDSPLIAASVDTSQTGITAVRVWNTQTKQPVVGTPPLFGTVAMLGFYDPSRVGFLLRRDPIRDGPLDNNLFSGFALFDLPAQRLLPMALDETTAIGRGRGPQVGYDAAVSLAARRVAVGFHLHDAVHLFSIDNVPPITLKFSGVQQSYCSHLGFSPSGRYLIAACNPADAHSLGPEDWETKLLTVWDLGDSSNASDSPTTTANGQP